jgi:N-methylhydantoinase A
LPAIAALIAELEAEASAWIAQEGALVGAHDFVVSMRARYPDQAYELETIVPEARRAAPDGRALAALFHAEHARLYGFSDPASAVQVTTVRLGVIGRVPPVALPEVPPTAPRAAGTRRVRLGGEAMDALVYARADLGLGAVIHGPAIVEQQDTTLLLLPGWRAEADRLGTLHMTAERAR